MRDRVQVRLSAGSKPDRSGDGRRIGNRRRSESQKQGALAKGNRIIAVSSPGRGRGCLTTVCSSGVVALLSFFSFDPDLLTVHDD